MKPLQIKTYYTPAKNYWFPAFLHAEVLERLWANDGLCAEVLSWSGEPLNKWFYDEGKSIYLGCAYFSDNSISFSNGRHRTRWMMQQGLKSIPVCIAASSYYEALLSGLISRRGFEGEAIEGLRYAQ